MVKIQPMDFKRYVGALVMLIFASLMCLWALLIAINESKYIFYGFAGVFGTLGLVFFHAMTQKPRSA